MIESKQAAARRVARGAYIASAASLLIGAPAWAQSPAPAATPGAAAPNAPKPPIDITANHQDFYNDDNKSIYTGDVEVIQGTDRLRTPRLTIFFTKKDPNAAPKPAAAGGADTGNRKIEHMEAEGPVYFANPTQNGRGDHGVYTAADQTTVLTGNVVLVQGKNVSTGDKLILNQATNQAQLFSGQSSKRVRGVFYSRIRRRPPAARRRGRPHPRRPSRRNIPDRWRVCNP